MGTEHVDICMDAFYRCDKRKYATINRFLFYIYCEKNIRNSSCTIKQQQKTTKPQEFLLFAIHYLFFVTNLESTDSVSS
jgi:hypothetical protein